ncbi:GNAT family N-acetyltransferase [Mariniblastus fucicola]|uniref:Putative acetyltransferase n=1 Tax=Mariniblastus fucicola TaxID=980251 RepID=A0A5B9P784_9BACT|nr:GNAT family N-acetyltransferase [Mariniblastus fucicola]QEG22497.1 putative acetyltransferase [Mariniblastus fucicola]
MSVEIQNVDFNDSEQSQQFLMLMDQYACDPMGGGKPLGPVVRDTLVEELQKQSSFNAAIAYVDGQPAGLVNYIEGFSTFAAKPLINIHDLAVHSDFRGRGLSHQLLAFVEKEAEKLGCCKLTLEVLAENLIAKNSYGKFGFEPYQLSEAGGPAQFWQKKLS